MTDEGTIRRSRRIREKKRGAGKQREQVRMSVGEAMGLTPHAGAAGNLAEARALQDARAAADAREEDRASGSKDKSSSKKKKRSRSRSLPRQEKPKATVDPTQKEDKAGSVHGTPGRMSEIRDSLDARKKTYKIFDTSTSGDDDDDMPELEGTSSEEKTEGDSSSGDGKDDGGDGKRKAEDKLSVIQTPLSQRGSP